MEKWLASKIISEKLQNFLSLIEFRTQPKGYSDMEIETLFAKYDIDGDRALNLEEQKKMFEDMAHESEEIRKALKELEATSDQLAFLLLSIS